MGRRRGRLDGPSSRCGGGISGRAVLVAELLQFGGLSEPSTHYLQCLESNQDLVGSVVLLSHDWSDPIQISGFGAADLVAVGTRHGVDRARALLFEEEWGCGCKCRHLTVNECQRRDQKRRLNVAHGDGIRVIVLLIKFADHKDMEVPPREYYEELFNGDGQSEVNPVGSVKEWLRYNSLGKYQVYFDVRDWEVAAKPEKEYTKGTSGIGHDLEPVFGPTLTKMDQAGTIDWYDGYFDEDAYLNHLVVLTSGLVAEVGDRPCLPDYSRHDRIWSNGAAGGGPDSWLSEDFFQVAGWSITSAFSYPICDRNDNTVLKPLRPATMSVITHEYLVSVSCVFFISNQACSKELNQTVHRHLCWIAWIWIT